MFTIIDCLTVRHDAGLVLLAAAVCVFGWGATMVVAERAVPKGEFNLWRVLLAVSAGSTVWCTHFIGMLAYETSIKITYEPTLTLLSFVVGALFIGVGLNLGSPAERSPARRVAGGALTAAGVVVLHYLGMSALQMPARLVYDPKMVIASVAVCLGFGIAALGPAFVALRAYAGLARAALLIAMTVALHFAAVSAAEINFYGMPVDVDAGLSRGVLAAAVTAASILVMVIGMASVVIDQKLSLRIRAEAEKFRTLSEGAFEAVIVHADGQLVDANPAALTLFKIPKGCSTVSLNALFRDFETDGADIRTHLPTECIMQCTEGVAFPAELSRRTILLPSGGTGELLAIRDLTARKAAEAKIAHMAMHDALTELPNRRLFSEMADKACALGKRSDQPFAVIVLDVDHFKLINDLHGHGGGDELIRCVANRILGALRDGDMVARFGGDEFAILQSATHQPQQSVVLVERLLRTLQEPHNLGDTQVTVSASIGIALFPGDGTSIDELLRNADTAMYRAKADGRATYRFFEPGMDEALAARRRLEQRLRRAVAEKKLTVAYQPLVDCDTFEPIAFEALVRWNDAELGNISPAEFIPVAEESGLILSLGEFVLRTACADAAGWRTPLRVAVNLSAVQFKHRNLAETVRTILAETGLPGGRLELEVTESLLVDSRDDAMRILAELKSMGIRIAMDDFGTGYSSLSYLQSFPFDKIKIDRSFVSDLESNSQNAGIVRAVTSMGKSLHMCVVAEGVETREQANILRGLDCDQLQGYLIAKPMPAAEIQGFLSQPRRYVGRTALAIVT